MKPYLLKETSWLKIKDGSYNVALLPWGATEPHNYHLPCGTDVLETEAIAVEAARKANEKGAGVMVLPCIPFGAQNPGQIELPFCINLPVSTQLAVLRDIMDSLYGQGIRKVLVLNGHGGNDFKGIIRELQPDYPGLFLGLSEWFRIGSPEKHFEEEGDHAGEMETSLMLHLHPELVSMEAAGDGKSAPPKYRGLSDGRAWTPRNWSEISRDTGVGDPRRATAEKGKAYFDEITDQLASFLHELSEKR